MTAGEHPSPPMYSPDGRFVWQDGAWVPVPPPPPLGHGHPPYAGVPPQPQPWGGAQHAPYVTRPTPKSTAIAIVLSFIWPGAGHLYVGADYPGGSNDKAIIFMVLSGVCFLLSLTIVGIVISFPLWLGCAIYTMIDANRAAQAWNGVRGFPINS